MISQRSLDALRAAIKVVGTAPERAAQVFVLATQDDPALADGWLGRYATGERTLTVLSKLSENAERLGEGLSRLQLSPAIMGAFFEIEYARIPIVDQPTARLAYAAALLDAEDYKQASDLLDDLPADHPQTGYVRACLASKTQRWPDVLAAVGVCAHDHRDDYLARAASVLEAWAAASLGLIQPALQAVQRVLDGPGKPTQGLAARGTGASDPLTRDALFCKALVLRYQGENEEAQSVLTGIRVQWPDFERAQVALNDPKFGLTITDTETIATRTDPWDYRTETSAAEREAQQAAQSAKQLLAEGEARLQEMVGLDAVKQRITQLRRDTIARVLRERRGLSSSAVSRHLLMVGPPGVGKTETARVIASMNCGLGLLRRPGLTETRRSELVGRHLGDTENNTREKLEQSLGATLFIDEFGDLIQAGYSGGDAFGLAIIGELVPFMENHRDDIVVIAAGYPKACERVLASNDGLSSRFSTTIEFGSYTPDQLLEIMVVIAARDHDRFAPDALEVLREPFARYYTEHRVDSSGDLIRIIDTPLGNGRFARSIVEKAQMARNNRIVESYGLSMVDLSDESVGADVPDDAWELLTKEDVALGHWQALPPAMQRGMSAS